MVHQGGASGVLLKGSIVIVIVLISDRPDGGQSGLKWQNSGVWPDWYQTRSQPYNTDGQVYNFTVQNHRIFRHHQFWTYSSS